MNNSDVTGFDMKPRLHKRSPDGARTEKYTGVECYSSRQGALVIEPFDVVYPERSRRAQGTIAFMP